MHPYSVFIFNVSSCNDRYCSAYGRDYSMAEMFDRVKSIEKLSAVDLVMNRMFLEQMDEIQPNLNRTGLKVASVAVDTFANPAYQQGSLSSVDPAIRRQAVADAKNAIDFAVRVGCRTVTLWPGQDGYDYIFQADYIRERTLFQEALAEICAYNPEVDITLEYKLKEPRTHSYISTVGTTLLMIQSVGARNLGVALDYGHSLLGGESPAEAAAMCRMYGDRLKHIHINDNYGQWDDDLIVGSVHTLEVLEFLYWLKRTEYSGYITLDQFPYREDGRDAVSESAEWLWALEKIIDEADTGKIEAVLKKKNAVESSRLMRNLLFGGVK